ncbi:MAG: LLM class flavin-dependent oxidoreductase [Burkholderiales bacterium]
MPSVSLVTDGREAPDAFLAKAMAGESGGAARMWVANHLFERDPVSLAALALGATRRLPAALMAVSPFTMHPVQAAMIAATLDEVYPGRVSLSLGVGAPVDLASAGVEAPRPIAPMRDAITIIRALLAGETVQYEGRKFSVRGRALASGARQVPILLAASGPQMLELAGEVADGVLISAGTSVEFVHWSLEHVRRGAAGRPVRACGLVFAATDADREVAHARLRRPLAVVLRGAHHRMNLDLAGTVLDQEALGAAAARGDWAAAEAMITPQVLAHHAVCGTPADVRERIAAYHAAGIEEVVLSGPRDGAQAAALLDATK